MKTPDARALLHCTEAGSGPPVLLLHGLFDSQNTWSAILPIIARQMRAYAVDLPGFGQTPLPADWGASLSGMMDAVMKCLDQQHISQTSLVGSSMGGSLALGIAGRYPERVSKIVLLNPYGLPILPTAAKAARGFLAYCMNDTILKQCARAIYARSLYRADLISEALIERIVAPFRTLKRRKDVVRFLQGISIEEIMEMDARLPQIVQPTLLIWGKEDRWLSAAHGLRLADRLPHSQILQLADCGHLPQMDRPQAVAAALLPFLCEA